MQASLLSMLALTQALGANAAIDSCGKAVAKLYAGFGTPDASCSHGQMWSKTELCATDAGDDSCAQAVAYLVANAAKSEADSADANLCWGTDFDADGGKEALTAAGRDYSKVEELLSEGTFDICSMQSPACIKAEHEMTSHPDCFDADKPGPRLEMICPYSADQVSHCTTKIEEMASTCPKSEEYIADESKGLLAMGILGACSRYFSPPTCGDIKKAYKDSGCCKDMDSKFAFPKSGSRRMSAESAELDVAIGKVMSDLHLARAKLDDKKYAELHSEILGLLADQK